MGITMINADAVQWAREYNGPLFHALLCDPPYHLTSIVKRFGAEGAAPAQYGKDGAFARASKGFMGKQWDGGDVAFAPETWYEFAKVLYPGAFGMAFASSRGWHRLACAIEDGGFIIHPSIFGWSYGSGFPKATRVKDERFAGHRYGLQALKPALEPIIVFQKPYEGRPIDNITETGAGALNIDGGRIGTDEIPSNQWTDNAHPFGGGAGNEYETVTNRGRWPANFILMDDAAAQALDRQSGIQSGGFVRNRTNGARVFNNNGQDTGYHTDEIINEPDAGASRFFFRVQESIDTADPVYYCAKASTEERDAGLDCYLTIEYDTTNLGKEISILWTDENTELVGLLQRVISEVGQITNLSIAAYGNKISVWCPRDSLSIIKTEISKITESKILSWLTHLLTRDCIAGVNCETANGGNGARSVAPGNELIQKIGISQKRDGFHITDVVNAILGLLSKISKEENWKVGKSIHPTVKPIELARYLATLLLPPTEYQPRKLFIPFAGVASEVIGSMQAGWDEITGVELTEEYIPIANARIEYWRNRGWQTSLFDTNAIDHPAAGNLSR